MSNFDFLDIWQGSLANYARQAEKQVYENPNGCLQNLGILTEKMTEALCREEHLSLPYQASQMERLEALRLKGVLRQQSLEDYHTIRMLRNEIAHGNGRASSRDAEDCLRRAFYLAVEFRLYYDPRFQPPAYHPPVRKDMDFSACFSDPEEAQAPMEKPRITAQKPTVKRTPSAVYPMGPAVYRNRPEKPSALPRKEAAPVPAPYRPEPEQKPAPVKDQSRGWMVFSLILLILLAISLFFHFRQWRVQEKGKTAPSEEQIEDVLFPLHVRTEEALQQADFCSCCRKAAEQKQTQPAAFCVRKAGHSAGRSLPGIR